MTLGEKIKKSRKAKRMTQNELAKGKITRNMLSAIESDKASPSLETLLFIADRLGVCASYLLSEEDDLSFYIKNTHISDIKRLFADKKYKNCIDKIRQIENPDDELEYILTYCYFEMSKKAVLGGSLKSGEEYLLKSKEHSNKTIYDTSKIENASLIYTALCHNIQSPLLELDTKAFKESINRDFEYDFYNYLLGDYGYNYSNPVFKKHLEAKNLMKERKYHEALSIMRSIEEEKTPESYNAYVIFSVYTDIESCYKQLADFENAYRYASKRLSIIEGFKL